MICIVNYFFWCIWSYCLSQFTPSKGNVAIGKLFDFFIVQISITKVNMCLINVLVHHWDKDNKHFLHCVILLTLCSNYVKLDFSHDLGNTWSLRPNFRVWGLIKRFWVIVNNQFQMFFNCFSQCWIGYQHLGISICHKYFNV
jgi:hypothetical protein